MRYEVRDPAWKKTENVWVFFVITLFIDKENLRRPEAFTY